MLDAASVPVFASIIPAIPIAPPASEVGEIRIDYRLDAEYTDGEYATIEVSVDGAYHTNQHARYRQAIVEQFGADPADDLNRGIYRLVIPAGDGLRHVWRFGNGGVRLESFARANTLPTGPPVRT